MTLCTTLATQLSAPGVEMAGSGTCAAGRIRRARLLWIALLVDPARPSAAPVLTPDVWAARRGRAPPAAASRPQEVKAQLLRRAWVHRRAAGGLLSWTLTCRLWHCCSCRLGSVRVNLHGGRLRLAALLALRPTPSPRKPARRAASRCVGESAAQAAAQARPVPLALVGAGSSSYLRTLRARAAAVEVAQQTPGQAQDIYDE